MHDFKTDQDLDVGSDYVVRYVYFTKHTTMGSFCYGDNPNIMSPLFFVLNRNVKKSVKTGGVKSHTEGQTETKLHHLLRSRFVIGHITFFGLRFQILAATDPVGKDGQTLRRGPSKQHSLKKQFFYFLLPLLFLHRFVLCTCTTYSYKGQTVSDFPLPAALNFSAY